MAGPITISVLGDTRDLRSEVRGAKGELGGLGTTASKVGNAVKLGLATAAAGAVAFGVKSVRAASDAQQSLGATETVFGRFADTVEKRSESAATAVGLSANEYRELANTLGAGLKNADLPLRKVTDLTGKLNTRAADLAATFGGPTSDAVSAIGSLLRGEADPIERYGIGIKEADVQARLAAQGLDKLEGSAGKQAAMQARLDLLFRQSADSAGAFRREGDTLAGAGQRLDATVEDLSARFGTLLLPALTDLATYARTDVLPQVEKLAGWLEDNRGEISETAGAVKDGLLPPLKALGNVVGDVAGFLADLPAPVRSFGAEALAAALILPRLTSGITNIRNSAGGMVTNLRNAETRTTMLRNAAAGAAGAGGLALLADASNDTEGALRDLKRTAGITALGFAAGGPWGAAVAGFVSIVGKAESAGEGFGLSQEDLAVQIDKVTESLNAQTGAFTKRTRAQVAEDLGAKGYLTTAKDLGLELPKVTTAIMQGAEGIERFRDRAMATIPQTAEARTKLVDLTEAMFDMSGALRTGQRGFMLEREAMGKSGRKIQEHRDLVNKLSKTYSLLPREVETILEAVGAKASTGEVRTLARQYDRTPKEIRTLLKLAGVEDVTRGTKRAKDALEGVGRTKPDTRPWQAGIAAGVADAIRAADKGGKDVARHLETGVRQARPDLGGFSTSFSSGIDRLRGVAANGGDGIGSDMGQGINLGIGDWSATIAQTAYDTVAQAIREARRAADARSPSRKTRQLGRDMGEGLEKGLTEKEKKIRATQRRIIDRVLGDLGAAIDRTKGRLDQLNDARASYVAGIADAARETANIATAGLLEDNTQTAAGIKATLEDRLAAIRNFHAKVKTLQSQGLKGEALRQLLAAGVDAGTVTAEALLAGGKKAVTNTVELTNQIKGAATNLGNIGGREFYAAGITAQTRLLAGLQKDRKALDDAGRKMGVRLARAIARELDRGLEDYDRVTGRGKKDRPRLEVTTHPRTRIADRSTDAGAKARTLTLTAEQVTAIQRGRAIQLDLDAFFAAGGRRKARR